MKDVQEGLRLVAGFEDQALGLDVAAEAERAILAHYQLVLDAFSASKVSDPPADDLTLRRVRVAVDARSAAERFTKEAANLRALLARVRELEGAEIGRAGLVHAAAMAALASAWDDSPVFRRRSPAYVPPPPSPDLVAERIRLAEVNRARKAAKAKGPRP